MSITRPIQRSLQRALQRGLSDISGWTPRRLFLAGEQGAWFDPSTLSTLYQDSAGTTPVTALGQPVGLMLDRSGRGNHASQPTATARPTLQADASGRRYLQFDGVDDFLSVPGFNPAGYFFITAGFSIDTALAAGSNDYAIFINRPTTTGITKGWQFSATRCHVADGIKSGVVDAALAASTPTVRTGIYSGPVRLRSNGGDVAVYPDQALGNSQGNYTTAIGALDSGASRYHHLKGRIYSLIAREGAPPTQAQIEAAERYANARTGAY